MGKVTVIIESEFIPTKQLYELTNAMIPDEHDWHAAMLEMTGVTPEEIKIFIVPGDG